MIHFPFRTGTQTNPGVQAPNSPLYDDAYTICVPDDAHRKLHSWLNSQIVAAGRANGGLISYEKLLELVDASIDDLPSSISDECKRLYKKTIRDQNKMPSDRNLRGQLRPTKEIIELLKKLWSGE